MPKILMKFSTPGSVDGFTTRLYLKDQEYDLPEGLAKTFAVDMRVGNYVRVRKEPDPVLVPTETAVEEKVPEIKIEPKKVIEVIEKKKEVETKEPISEVESKNTRVYELANELKVPWKEVIEIAQKLDINVRVAQAGLTDSEVEKIKSARK